MKFIPKLDFALPLLGGNRFLPHEGCGWLGRRLAGLAGTGALAVEGAERLYSSGDSRRDRCRTPLRALLEGVCKTLRRWTGDRRGNLTEACSIGQLGSPTKGG